MIAAGIEFGISNSKIGVFKDGKVQIVPNSMGDPCTPSVVSITEDNEIIGEETLVNKIDEKNTITEIKKLLGKNINDLKDLKEINNLIFENDKLQLKINRKGNDEYFIPERIVSLLFKKLIQSASDFSEFGITKAVIAVPVYFDEKRRLSIKEAAELAGIELLEIIEEPIAAALAYDFGTKEQSIKDSLAPSAINNNSDNKKVLVFDLGGGSLDISVLTIEGTNISIKSSLDEDNFIGGIKFDNKLIEFCINDFCQKMAVDENEVRKDLKALKRLRNQCEKAKKKLSNNESAIINVYNFFGGFDLYIKITRERFNEECDDLFLQIENIIEEVLSNANFTAEDIDDVILAGGSSRITKIKEILKNKFTENKIRDNLNPDEIIAMGASWKAHKLLKNSSKLNSNNLEVLPSSVGIAMVSKIREERQKGQLMCVLIPKDSKLPAKSAAKKFKTIKDDQEYFKIKIFSGEEKYAKDNKYIGEFILDNLPKGKAKSITFEMFLEVNNEGIITINAEVESTGAKVSKSFSMISQEKTDTQEENKNQNEYVYLKSNPIYNKELSLIKGYVKNINEMNEALKTAENDEDKISYLNELCNSCLEIINIYENIKNDNNSENLNEKIFNYTKLLFSYYSQIIIIDKEEKYTENVINKIKELMPKYKNDNIENLLESFIELKNENPKKYIEIVLFCVEMLYQEGDQILEERKKYARYYSKKFYQKGDNIKKIIDDDLIQKMDYKLDAKFKEIEKNYGSKVAEIDSFVNVIKEQINGKDTPFLPQKSGFTSFGNMIMQTEDTYLMVDIYQEMAESLSKGEITEAEAYIRANIIIINFTVFKNYDFSLYDRLNRRINYIYERLEIDDEDEPNWHKTLEEINLQINQKKKELEKIKNTELEKNDRAINNIVMSFNENMRENKPLEFIKFILEDYPYSNFDPEKKDELLENEFEKIFEIIFPKYHPDNYKDRPDFLIYNEIYILLVQMEEKLIKKSKEEAP